MALGASGETETAIYRPVCLCEVYRRELRTIRPERYSDAASERDAAAAAAARDNASTRLVDCYRRELLNSAITVHHVALETSHASLNARPTTHSIPVYETSLDSCSLNFIAPLASRVHGRITVKQVKSCINTICNCNTRKSAVRSRQTDRHTCCRNWNIVK